MTVVKRSEAVGERTIQTRWVDREKDGRVKSRLVFKRLQSMSGAYTARDVFTNTVDVVSEKRCWLRAHTTETMTRSQTKTQFRLTCTQQFLHADVDQDLFAEPPEPDEWYDAGLKEDEVWEIEQSTVRISQSTKIVA